MANDASLVLSPGRNPKELGKSRPQRRLDNEPTGLLNHPILHGRDRERPGPSGLAGLGYVGPDGPARPVGPLPHSLATPSRNARPRLPRSARSSTGPLRRSLDSLHQLPSPPEHVDPVELVPQRMEPAISVCLGCTVSLRCSSRTESLDTAYPSGTGAGLSLRTTSTAEAGSLCSGQVLLSCPSTLIRPLRLPHARPPPLRALPYRRGYPAGDQAGRRGGLPRYPP